MITVNWMKTDPPVISHRLQKKLACVYDGIPYTVTAKKDILKEDGDLSLTFLIRILCASLCKYWSVSLVIVSCLLLDCLKACFFVLCNVCLKAITVKKKKTIEIINNI